MEPGLGLGIAHEHDAPPIKQSCSKGTAMHIIFPALHYSHSPSHLKSHHPLEKSVCLKYKNNGYIMGSICWHKTSAISHFKNPWESVVAQTSDTIWILISCHFWPESSWKLSYKQLYKANSSTWFQLRAAFSWISSGCVTSALKVASFIIFPCGRINDYVS